MASCLTAFSSAVVLGILYTSESGLNDSMSFFTAAFIFSVRTRDLPISCCISSSYSAYVFLPVVSSPTIVPSAIPTAPTSAAALPPPGTGALLPSSEMNRSHVLLSINTSCFLFLEKSGDLSCAVHIDIFGCRHLRESRHSHYVSCKSYNKACSCRSFYVSYTDPET